MNYEHFHTKIIKEFTYYSGEFYTVGGTFIRLALLYWSLFSLTIKNLLCAKFTSKIRVLDIPYMQDK